MSLFKTDPEAGVFLGPETKPNIQTEPTPINLFGWNAHKWIESMWLAPYVVYNQYSWLEQMRLQIWDLVWWIKDFVTQCVVHVWVDQMESAQAGKMDSGT